MIEGTSSTTLLMAEVVAVRSRLLTEYRARLDERLLHAPVREADGMSPRSVEVAVRPPTPTGDADDISGGAADRGNFYSRHRSFLFPDDAQSTTYQPRQSNDPGGVVQFRSSPRPRGMLIDIVV